MNISIHEVTGRGWIVTLGECSIDFSTRQSADQFIARLQQRLDAPHVLPVFNLPVADTLPPPLLEQTA